MKTKLDLRKPGVLSTLIERSLKGCDPRRADTKLRRFDVAPSDGKDTR